MHDIKDRTDIILLVDTFYDHVRNDELIGGFFNEVVQIHWDAHMPTMYDFWESTLLYTNKYKGNPMTKHIALNDRKTISVDHFERWLSLWTSNVDAHFQGDIAEMAKAKASQIAELMKYKIEQHNNFFLAN